MARADALRQRGGYLRITGHRRLRIFPCYFGSHATQGAFCPSIYDRPGLLWSPPGSISYRRGTVLVAKGLGQAAVEERQDGAFGIRRPSPHAAKTFFFGPFRKNIRADDREKSVSELRFRGAFRDLRSGAL